MHDELLRAIRSVPDFPKKGIIFRDITTLLQDATLFARAVDLLADRYRHVVIDKVVGIEARGFVLGAPLAYRLHAGFVPVRKPGKLPSATLRQEYALEYGVDAVEMHSDAIRPGEHVLMHDDLLATGGTMRAATRLVEQMGGTIVGISFLVELAFLKGREQLAGYDLFSLVSYETE